jgi:phosphonatase-like hydrolase
MDMKLRLPSLAVFDLAGTTIQDDGTVAAVFKEVLTAEDIRSTSEEIARVRGAAKREAFRQLAREPGQAERLYENFFEGIRRRYTASPPREVPGTSGTFTWLREQGVKIALNTGFERETAAMLLSALGWSDPAVDAVVCGDEVAAGRPAPDMILEAMRRTGVADPGGVMVAGDTVLDLQAGSAAGAGWVIGVTSGAHDYARLSQAPHTHILQSVAEIPKLLSGSIRKAV